MLVKPCRRFRPRVGVVRVLPFVGNMAATYLLRTLPVEHA